MIFQLFFLKKKNILKGSPSGQWGDLTVLSEHGRSVDSLGMRVDKKYYSLFIPLFPLIIIAGNDPFLIFFISFMHFFLP